MKKILTLLVIIICHYNILACTFIPETFCRSLEVLSNDIVLSGEIVSIDSTGIDIEIIDVLRGEESRPIIRVWDGTDFDCNGIVSMAASLIGKLNDSIVMILPRITEKENAWDVIGDYRRPNFFNYTTKLILEDGILKGLISGHSTFPPQYNQLNMNYNEFKTKLIEDGDCSSIRSNTKSTIHESRITVNNPFTSNLTIQLSEVINRGIVRLYSLAGKLLLTEKIEAERFKELDLSGFHAGMYILEIEINGNRKLIKVVKQ